MFLFLIVCILFIEDGIPGLDLLDLIHLVIILLLVHSNFHPQAFILLLNILNFFNYLF